MDFGIINALGDLAGNPKDKVGAFTLDLASTATTVTITGVGFAIHNIKLVGAVNTKAVCTVGFGTTSGSGCLHQYQYEVAGGWGVGPYTAFLVAGNGVYYGLTLASASTASSGSFTFNVYKNNTPTGSCVFYYLGSN